MGKLLRYVGEDNVLWGTDSIWYGSPQDQIQAFRTFQSSEEFQERFGCPAITPEIRQKVFVLNAVVPYQVDEEEVRRFLAVDQVTNDKIVYRRNPQPSFLTYGPKSCREFMNFLKWGG